MKPILNILPQEQLKIYSCLAQVTELDFVLFGGTALALQLGHRESVDFDFFTHKCIDKIQDKLLNLNGIKPETILQQESDTLVFLTDSQVKLSFFGELDFVSKAQTIQTDDKILRMADIQSLLATKLKVICDRAEYKDYFDIATILQQKADVNLKDGLNDVAVFFGNDFPIMQILKGLTYFEDGDLHKLQHKEREILVQKVREINEHILDLKKKRVHKRF